MRQVAASRRASLAAIGNPVRRSIVRALAAATSFRCTGTTLGQVGELPAPAPRCRFPCGVHREVSTEGAPRYPSRVPVQDVGLVLSAPAFCRSTCLGLKSSSVSACVPCRGATRGWRRSWRDLLAAGAGRTGWPAGDVCSRVRASVCDSAGLWRLLFGRRRSLPGGVTSVVTWRRARTSPRRGSATGSPRRVFAEALLAVDLLAPVRALFCAGVVKAPG